MCAVVMTKEFLTIDEIAEMLDIHRNTVQEWIQSEELKAFRLGRGRGYRIARTDLDSFLETRRYKKRQTEED